MVLRLLDLLVLLRKHTFVLACDCILIVTIYMLVLLRFCFNLHLVELFRAWGFGFVDRPGIHDIYV